MPAKTVLEIGQEKKDIRARNERIMVNTVSVKAIVEQRKYDFLRTDEHIKDRLMFLTLGGSHAYGTNVEGSDIDIRGCALLRESDLLGSTNFEQLVDHDTDTTVYSSRKLISLLSQAALIALNCLAMHQECMRTYRMQAVAC